MTLTPSPPLASALAGTALVATLAAGPALAEGKTYALSRSTSRRCSSTR